MSASGGVKREVAKARDELNQYSAMSTDKSEPEHVPLNPSEFRDVLQQLDTLGFTWTSDLPPSLLVKDGNDNGNSANERLEEIQERYPMFPNELGSVIWYTLTGSEPLLEMVGSEEDLKIKSDIVRDLLITPEYRDEFFFKHMMKVPYFANVDWEVIVKTSERGVQNFPGNAYAIVSILLQSNLHAKEESRHFTFAINQQRLETLMTLFGELNVALRRASRIGDCLKQGGEDDRDATY